MVAAASWEQNTFDIRSSFSRVPSIVPCSRRVNWSHSVEIYNCSCSLASLVANTELNNAGSQRLVGVQFVLICKCLVPLEFPVSEVVASACGTKIDLWFCRGREESSAILPEVGCHRTAISAPIVAWSPANSLELLGPAARELVSSKDCRLSRLQTPGELIWGDSSRVRFVEIGRTAAEAATASKEPRMKRMVVEY